MKKKLIMTIFLIVLVSFLFGCNQIASNSQEVILYGVAHRSKGCFAVESTVDCTNNGLSFDFVGKIVEIKGVVEKQVCSGTNLQCYEGSSFSRVDSVKVIDFNVNPKIYLHYIIDSNEFGDYITNIAVTGPTVCNRTLVAIGDNTRSNVDLNSIFVLKVQDGIIVHFNTFPSICSCGNVNNEVFDVHVDVNKETNLLQWLYFGESYQGLCAN